MLRVHETLEGRKLHPSFVEIKASRMVIELGADESRILGTFSLSFFFPRPLKRS